ncbi:MAG: transcription elongation factor GreA [Capsulimonadaceae bacterium]|nr:transcription elongation factor GreA [Capsulimonadaceae bacterium]
MEHEIVLTSAKYAELQTELQRLISTERPAIAERIRQARALGDLSENFDYQDAKRQQGFLESRIANIKGMLERAYVAEYQNGSDTVVFGSRVKVFDQEYDEEIEYTLVGAVEADPANYRISNTSPLGKSLLGCKVGDIIEVPTPAGRDKYKVIEIN